MLFGLLIQSNAFSAAVIVDAVSPTSSSAADNRERDRPAPSLILIDRPTSLLPLSRGMANTISASVFEHPVPANAPNARADVSELSEILFFIRVYVVLAC